MVWDKIEYLILVGIHRMAEETFWKRRFLGLGLGVERVELEAIMDI